MSMNKTCAISSAISFLISVDMDGERPRHLYQLGLSPFSQAGLDESGPSPRDGDRAEQLAHPHSIRVFFATYSVPVVQRIEQGFPKMKVASYHTSSAVVSTTQIRILLVACTGSFVV